MGHKPARGRGNQGDWRNDRGPCAVPKEHRDHNAEVDRKKRLKKAAKEKKS